MGRCCGDLLVRGVMKRWGWREGGGVMKRQRREWRLCGDLCGRGVVWWVRRFGEF